jgi:hypothetical protein
MLTAMSTADSGTLHGEDAGMLMLVLLVLVLLVFNKLRYLNQSHYILAGIC